MSTEAMDALPMHLMIGAGCTTILLGSGLAYVLSKSRSKNAGEEPAIEEEAVEELDLDKFPGGYITIYYGSQTGTAESFANDIEREGEEHGFKVNVVDLEEIEEDIVNEIMKKQEQDDRGKNRAVFLASTYGEGEPTDNAVAFARFLKQGEGKDDDSDNDGEEKKGEEEINTCFAGLEFSVFGLGNKQYEHYNAMGKLIDTHLERLGGNRIVPLGLGDDDDDLEGDFETWKDTKLWPGLKKKYIKSSSIKDSVCGKSEKLPDCHYAIEYINGPAPLDETPIENVHMSSKHYFTGVDCPVTVKRELRNPADDGSTLHMEIDISNAGDKVTYQTADNLGILPVNSDDDVSRLASALGYDLGAYIRLQPAPGHEAKHSVPFPNPCTIQECLARYCDLNGPPRRSELKLLAPYAKDATSKKALLRMASKEGKAEYKEKIVEAKIGVVDIISKLCPSIEMPLEHFISVCPRLHPRYYTISSSSTVHPTSVHVTVSVLKETRADGSSFKGVCSNYLSDIISNGKVRIFARDSTFRLPTDAKKPIIMIGPGTGIAPMRALLQERSHQKLSQKLKVGENILYFGCKKRDLDFIYQDELKAFEKEGTLTQMHLAFSREQDKKVYVQHLLSKNAKDTWKLISKGGAYIYVCGGVKMGQDVSDALKRLISEHGDLGTTDAKKYLDEMAKEGRFVQELWA